MTRTVRSREAQVAFEFSFMVLLAFIFLAVILVIVTFYLERSREQRVGSAMMDAATMVKRELLLATSVEDGYQRNFTLPPKLANTEYTVTNDASTLSLRTMDGQVYMHLIPNVTGSLVKGENRVRRIDGRIILG